MRGCRVVVRLALAALLVLALNGGAAAQSASATLLLQVQDSTGAPLAGVTVTAIHLRTGVGRRAVTTRAGTTVIPLLAPGDYTLSASVAGFRQAEVEVFHLEAGANRSFRITLEPGPVADTVTVTADAVRARTGNSAVGEVFEGDLLTMTPVASREVTEYAWQAPGAAPPAPGSRLSTQGSTGVNVSGAREAANNFLLDGVDNNDQFLNRLVVSPSLDAVQEFTLLQNTYDAEYGRNAGGQVNVVLKSGGRRTQGTIYEYFRDRALEARGPFDPEAGPEPFRRRHQFGGTIGGPLGALPGFYFASVEGRRERAADARLGRVPAPAMRAGDFSASPQTIVDPFTGRPFPGNRIPENRLDPTGLALAARYPDPNRGDASANLVSSPVGARDGVSFTLKTDHHMGATPVFARYTFSRDHRDLPFPVRGRNLPGYGIEVLDQGHNVAAGLTQTFGGRLFNDLRVGWNSLRRENFPQSRGTDGFADFGIRGPGLPSDDLGYPALNVTGFETLGDDPNLPVARRTHTIHVADTLGIDRGRHYLKAGGELRHYRSDGFNHVFARGQVNFTGAFTGSGLADLLLGLPTVSLLAANDNPQALRTTALNLFAQDDWRLSPSVTVNAGVRYELNAPPVDAHDRMRVFDLETASLVDVGVNGVPRAGVRTDRNNLAPRVGVSWNARDDGRLTVRAGWGIFYDAGTLIENSALYFNPPYFDFTVFVPSATRLLSAADPFPDAAGFTPPVSVNTLDPDFETAYAHHASLSVETRVRGLDVTARYVGSRGEHFVRKRNLNQPPPGPGNIQARRPLPAYGDILFVESAATSEYHALQLRVARERASGLSLRGAYTWGKSIDDQSAFLASDGNDNTPQNSRDVAAERGLSDFDVRHRLSLAAVWTLPAGASAWARGWQVSALLTAMTGRPFTPRVSTDNSNTGNLGGQFGYDRPDEVAPGTPGSVAYGGRAFVVAAPFTYGNAGRNILTGPGYATLDLAVIRSFALGGTRRLEARLEVYNALNRDNLQLPETFVDRATFGQSLAAFPARQGQLAVRFSF